MKLPIDREELRARWAAGERFEFYLFYGHKPPESGVDESCLSQWFVRVFEIDDIEYPTAEHWMMAEKARLFEDDEMLKEILVAEGPREAKACGRKVANFDNEVWGEHKFEIVKRGNLAKFSQHLDLQEFLFSTATYSKTESETTLMRAAESGSDYDIESDPESEVKNQTETVSESAEIYRFESPKVEPAQSNVVLVEAAGRDTIWGIGLGRSNPKSQDPFTWRGLNLLGFALTAVRDELANQE